MLDAARHSAASTHRSSQSSVAAPIRSNGEQQAQDMACVSAVHASSAQRGASEGNWQLIETSEVLHTCHTGIASDGRP